MLKILIVFIFLTLYVDALSIKQKKENFINSILPHIAVVYDELYKQFKDIEKSTDTEKILKLQNIYGVKNKQDLLIALKPHPKSIVLAQAIVESGWGSSRFYKEANNLFGVWSSNPNQDRVPALEKRGGVKTIYLRKFKSVDESIRSYYFMIAKARAYKNFRFVRFYTDDVYLMVEYLDKYSEMGKKYTKTLQKIISYNKLTRYDK